MNTLNSKELNKKLSELKLLPLYTVKNVNYLSLLEELLIETKINLIEIPFRSTLATISIEKFTNSHKTIVGAGTIRNLEQAKAAKNSGAQFIVSPAVIPEVIEYCLDEKIPVIPGVATPRDINDASEYGLKVLKFFPADIYGGIKALHALKGPFPEIKFIPTGGISYENFSDYLKLDNVIAVGGSFIVSESSIVDEPEKVSKKLHNLMKQINQIREESHTHE